MNSGSSLRLMSIESVMPSSHLILCCPLLLLPPIAPSIRVFSNESALHIRWPKYWSFSLSISPSNKYSGLISFRMDWLDLLAVQEMLLLLPPPDRCPLKLLLLSRCPLAPRLPSRCPLKPRLPSRCPRKLRYPSRGPSSSGCSVATESCQCRESDRKSVV